MRPLHISAKNWGTTTPPRKTVIDHWLIRQPTTTTLYTDLDTRITTHTPEYGDHTALAIYLPQIVLIQTPGAKHTLKNPTTRSHPSFKLPIPRNLIDLNQLGNPATTTNTKHTLQTLTNLFTYDKNTTYKIGFAAAQVMTIIHEHHDIATSI